MSVSGLLALSLSIMALQHLVKLLPLPQGQGARSLTVFIGVNDVVNDIFFRELLTTYGFVL